MECHRCDSRKLTYYNCKKNYSLCSNCITEKDRKYSREIYCYYCGNDWDTDELTMLGKGIFACVRNCDDKINVYSGCKKCKADIVEYTMTDSYCEDCIIDVMHGYDILIKIKDIILKNDSPQTIIDEIEKILPDEI